MNLLILVAALAGLSSASPVDDGAKEARQTGDINLNDLRDGGPCKDISLVFARGSTEPGYMGSMVGPALCDGLKESFPDAVACQEVAPEYVADLQSNYRPKGTSDVAIEEAQELFQLAKSKCSNTTIVAGGYSQGAAVMHGSIPGLSSDIKDMFAGVVPFGDTRNAQDNGQIPDFPPDKTEIICAPGDLVCNGTLTITPAHLTYASYVPQAVEFLVSKI